MLPAQARSSSPVPDSQMRSNAPEAQSSEQKKYIPFTRGGFLGLALVSVVSKVVFLVITPLLALAALACLCLSKKMTALAIGSAVMIFSSFLSIGFSCSGIVNPEKANKKVEETIGKDHCGSATLLIPNLVAEWRINRAEQAEQAKLTQQRNAENRQRNAEIRQKHYAEQM